MVALKIKNFGGMIPAVDDRLLPENQAALSQNAWVHTGALEGMRSQQLVYTAASNLTRKVYRIPNGQSDKDHIKDSYWMEFSDQDTDVVRSPTANDSYERYYWTSPSTGPLYNTKARITSGQSPYTLGIPAPTVAPKITRNTGQYFLSVTPGIFTVSSNSPTIYYGHNYGVDTSQVQNGLLKPAGYELMGASTLTKNTGLRFEPTVAPAPLSSPANQYKTTGVRVEMRYGTVSGGQRVYISDSGTLSVGSPNIQPAGVQAYVGQGVLEARAYVYTWVSAYGEESAPSPAATFIAYSGDPWVVTVTPPDSSVTTGRNIATTRIYRTVTAAGGATTYFFVAEISSATTTYTDANSDDSVADNDILQTIYWNPPPSNLSGMIAMPNGVIAGFRNNEVWFCEPYRPHAWPTNYTLAVEYPIVGLGVIGQTLIVCTTGYPYAVTGVNPSLMTMSRIATYEPCTSRGSVVSTHAGVVYASPNGLCLAVPGAVNVITRQMVTKDHWQDLLYLRTLRGAVLNGSYYCWGSIAPGCYEPTAFENSAFTQIDYTGSYKGAMIDFQNQRVSYTVLSETDPVYNVWTDQWTGEVFLMHGGMVYWVNLSGANYDTYVWRSKIFDFPNKRNLEALRVYWSAEPNQTYTVPATVRLYADGRLVLTRDLVSSGELIRVPSGFKATYWQVEITGTVAVYSLEMATSTKELILV